MGAAVKDRLRRGELVLGCFQRIAAPEVMEICAAAGFDLVIVDLEHAPVSEADAVALIRCADAAGIPVVVRIPGADPAVLNRVLDAGPAGVQFPMIRSAAEAEAAVRATRYLPHGSRGVALSRVSGYGLRMSLGDYIRASVEELLVVAQVEDRVGLSAVAEIARVPEIDVVFLGLTDLTQDLGIPGQFEHPTLREAVARAVHEIRSAGKMVGVPSISSAMAAPLIELGATYVMCNDVRLLIEAATGFVGSLRVA